MKSDRIAHLTERAEAMIALSYECSDAEAPALYDAICRLTMALAIERHPNINLRRSTLVYAANRLYPLVTHP